VAEAPPAEIDSLNILRATHRAMNLALAGLDVIPDHVLVDGLPVKSMRLPHTALVKGDALSYSIAAASVMAKVTRDRGMIAADLRWPEYGFARHKGYPTPEHLAAVARLGPCPIHRRSFAPLRRPEPELFLS
jgi:ribonuclease HII